MQATRARRKNSWAQQSPAAARRAVASEVRSAFFDLQQADRVLETETTNVQAADESLDIAKSNFAAGLGNTTQHNCKPHPTSLGPAQLDSAQFICTTWPLHV